MKRARQRPAKSPLCEINKRLDRIPTRREMAAMEERLMAAIGIRTPDLIPLTTELKTANDSLESAVKKEKEQP